MRLFDTAFSSATITLNPSKTISKQKAQINKAELVEEVIGKVSITKKDAGNVVDAITDTITNTLKKGEKITLVSFGTFQIMTRKAKRGVNPKPEELFRSQQKRAPSLDRGGT
jgi:DNA-binding protein HU-beta